MEIVFVGGVHGVGKSSMCAESCRTLLGQHVTASGVIREARAQAIEGNSKLVSDVFGNQAILVRGFKELRKSSTSRFIVLDGHFALRSTRGYETIPSEVFGALGITAYACIFDDPENIAARLASRDQTAPRISEIDDFQKIEIDHAYSVSKLLRVELRLIRAFDSRSLTGFIDAQLMNRGSSVT